MYIEYNNAMNFDIIYAGNSWAAIRSYMIILFPLLVVFVMTQIKI